MTNYKSVGGVWTLEENPYKLSKKNEEKVETLKVKIYEKDKVKEVKELEKPAKKRGRKKKKTN